MYDVGRILEEAGACRHDPTNVSCIGRCYITLSFVSVSYLLSFDSLPNVGSIKTTELDPGPTNRLCLHDVDNRA